MPSSSSLPKGRDLSSFSVISTVRAAGFRVVLWSAAPSSDGWCSAVAVFAWIEFRPRDVLQWQVNRCCSQDETPVNSSADVAAIALGSAGVAGVFAWVLW